LYDIWPGNGAGQFLQPRSPHGAKRRAESRGQSVLVTTDGVLAIDGIEVFCMQRWFLNMQMSAVNSANDG